MPPDRQSLARCLAGAALACGALMACGDEVASPAGPVPDVLGAPVSYFAQPLTHGGARRTIRVGADEWVVATEGGLQRVTTATVVGLGGAAGELQAAARVDGALLVSGANGLFVERGDALVRSPLDDLGRLPGVRQLLTENGRLWMAAADGLHLLEGGNLFRLDVPGLATADARIAYGAPVGDRPAVWVAAGPDLYGLTRPDEGWRARAEPVPGVVVDLAVDVAQRLWVVMDDGSVASRKTDGSWRVHEAIDGVTQVVADDQSLQVWLQTTRGPYRFDDREFRAVAGAPAAGIAPAPDGFVVATERGLERWVPERRLDLRGLNDGEVLAGPRWVEVRPSGVDRLERLTVALDGAAIVVTAPRYGFTLNPSGLTGGAHQLTLRADYADGEQVERAVAFTVDGGRVPNWVDDIQPLFQTRCALCHDAQGSARVLEDPQTWVDQIDLILENVRTGRMPLPPSEPLTSEEVARIEVWQAAGFPRGRRE